MHAQPGIIGGGEKYRSHHVRLDRPLLYLND